MLPTTETFSESLLHGSLNHGLHGTVTDAVQTTELHSDMQ